MSIGNSPKEDEPSIGQALRSARFDAGLSVEDVSRSTRVRVPIVRAIEADDFSRCGGDVYARGHLRTLARVVGLDPDELVARYDAEHGGKPTPTEPVTLFDAERVRPEPRRPNWTAAMVAAIAVVLGFVAFTYATGGKDDSSGPVADDLPATTPTPTAEPTRPADPRPDPTDSAVAAAPADKVTVKLIAESDSSWVSVRGGDGEVLHEGVLQRGDSRTLVDDERIDLVVGNAGAVELFVNGKRVEKVGEKGEVQRLTYTKGDPEAG